jgi:hypothetical protein
VGPPPAGELVEETDGRAAFGRVWGCYHDGMGTRLTIRGVSEEVRRRLKNVSQARGQSVNATVLEILASAVGVDERRSRLTRYETWNREDLADFTEALAEQRSVQPVTGSYRDLQGMLRRRGRRPPSDEALEREVTRSLVEDDERIRRGGV